MIKIKKVTKFSNIKNSVGLVKTYGLLALVAFMAFLMSASFSIEQPVVGAIALVIFVTLFIVQSIILTDTKFVILGGILTTVALVLPFFFLYSTFFFIAVVLLFVSVIYSGFISARESQNMIKTRIFRISRIVVGSLLTGIAIFFMAVLIITSGLRITEDRADQFVNILVSPILENFFEIEEFNSESSVREILREHVTSNIAETEEFGFLSVPAQDKVIEGLVGRMENNLRGYLGAGLNLDASLGANFHHITQLGVRDLSESAKIYLSIILIAFAWLSMRSVRFIIYIPFAALAWLVYELLISLGLVAVKLEARDKEVVSIK